MKKILYFVLFMGLALWGLCGCNTAKVEVPSSLKVGETMTLTLTGDSLVEIEPSNDNIIVKGNTITGAKVGETTLTIKGNKNTFTKLITVTEGLVINGNTNFVTGEVATLTASEEGGIWHSTDTSIASIDNGVVTALKEGQTVINYELGSVTVSQKINVCDLIILGETEGEKGDTLTLSSNVLGGTWSTSDETIASMDNEGNVTLLAKGLVTISYSYHNVTTSCEITVNETPFFTIDNSESELYVGDTLTLALTTNFASSLIKFSSSNTSVCTVSDGVITAVGVGTCTITGRYANCKALIEITVKETEVAKLVENIMANMTLEQKIGQLFVVGFNGTSLGTKAKEALNARYFGNYILMGANFGSTAELTQLTTDLQNNILEITGIPAFISTDNEGGRVMRFTNGATNWLGEMSLGATGNAENAYYVGLYMGEELRNYGINTDFAPVLDVNNNKNNPVIGIRSYGDDADKVAAFGVQMINGLKESHVMATAKHFPGHGDTATDSHYGLPTISYDMERLNNVELKPFKAAIDAGIDCIMTTHIIFSSIDSTYPATLSEKVLTGLLRNTLGYKGLIVTDGMNMDAISKNWGAAEAAVLAINAAADILTYTESTSASCTGYDAVLAAALDGRISLSRINDAVKRILETKYQYGLFDNSLPASNATSLDISNHIAYNDSLLKQSLTVVKGQTTLTKNEKVLICSNSDSNQGQQLSTLLNEKGFNTTYISYSSNLKTAGYNKVIFMAENASSSLIESINKIAETQSVIAISLKNPYDAAEYNAYGVICTYGQVERTYIALAALLAGEYKATGVLPVSLA